MWRQLTRGLRVLTRRSAADRDLSDELQHYLEEATADFVARGLPLDEARREARIAAGNGITVREQVRDAGWEHVIATAAGDLRYAVRRLRRDRSFTLVCVLTLALGIGASTAIFSTVNPVLFEPLPYPQASRIAMISDTGAGGEPVPVTFGTHREIAQRSRSFEALAVFKPWQPTIGGGAEPERLDGQRVSAGYFRVLGVQPVLGRGFQESEDIVRGPRVVIIADELWRRRFGADPAIVGREITLDEMPYLVAGVMPPGFENVSQPSAEIWTPLQYDTVLKPDAREWGHHLGMIGRLHAGVALATARDELARMARAPRPEFARVPWADLSRGLIVTSLQAEIARAIKPALLAVMAAVLLLLAIASANVTSLLLARGAQRRGEFAMRAALGASRGRLLRQVVVESLALAAGGGALGIAVAYFSVRVLIALSPPGLPRTAAIAVDESALLFCCAVTTLVGLAAGVVSASGASRASLQHRLQQVSQRTIGGNDRARRLLVVAETAVALTLLVGAGLLWRSLEHLLSTPPGFDASHVLTLQVQGIGRRFDADAAGLRFFTQALEHVQQLPDVVDAGLTSQLPLSGDLDGYGTHFERDGPSQVNDGAAFRYAVSPGYFRAMRIPLRAGRLIDAHDLADSMRVALLNEAFARRVFGGAGAIGQRLRFGPAEGDWFTVVGIVGDVKQTWLGAPDADAVYVPLPQWHWTDRVLSMVIRTHGDPAALAAPARRAIWAIDRDQPIVRVMTMERLVARSEADRRFVLVLFEAFAFAALALAAIGIYGVVSGAVTERTREIGVRAALGATRGEITTLVLRQGVRLAAAGGAIGVLAAAIASRGLTSLLFAVSPLDPLTYATVVGTLGAVTILACAAPAWRAARVDPAVTLRSE